ncbi:MAG: hypothetical protein U5L72_06540 [Bacteroidales bacterium]|nr:hypothetical protein [Bacteroidales bacterium]
MGINDLKTIGLDKDLASSITERYYRNVESIIEYHAGTKISTTWFLI